MVWVISRHISLLGQSMHKLFWETELPTNISVNFPERLVPRKAEVQIHVVLTTLLVSLQSQGSRSEGTREGGRKLEEMIPEHLIERIFQLSSARPLTKKPSHSSVPAHPHLSTFFSFQAKSVTTDLTIHNTAYREEFFSRLSFHLWVGLQCGGNPLSTSMNVL